MRWKSKPLSQERRTQSWGWWNPRNEACSSGKVWGPHYRCTMWVLLTPVHPQESEIEKSAMTHSSGFEHVWLAKDIWSVSQSSSVAPPNYWIMTWARGWGEAARRAALGAAFQNWSSWHGDFEIGWKTGKRKRPWPDIDRFLPSSSICQCVFANISSAEPSTPEGNMMKHLVKWNLSFFLFMHGVWIQSSKRGNILSFDRLRGASGVGAGVALSSKNGQIRLDLLQQQTNKWPRKVPRSESTVYSKASLLLGQRAEKLAANQVLAASVSRSYQMKRYSMKQILQVFIAKRLTLSWTIMNTFFGAGTRRNAKHLPSSSSKVLHPVFYRVMPLYLRKCKWVAKLKASRGQRFCDSNRLTSSSSLLGVAPDAVGQNLHSQTVSNTAKTWEVSRQHRCEKIDHSFFSSICFMLCPSFTRLWHFFKPFLIPYPLLVYIEMLPKMPRFSQIHLTWKSHAWWSPGLARSSLPGTTLVCLPSSGCPPMARTGDIESTSKTSLGASLFDIFWRYIDRSIYIANVASYDPFWAPILLRFPISIDFTIFLFRLRGILSLWFLDGACFVAWGFFGCSRLCSYDCKTQWQKNTKAGGILKTCSKVPILILHTTSIAIQTHHQSTSKYYLLLIGNRTTMYDWAAKISFWLCSTVESWVTILSTTTNGEGKLLKHISSLPSDTEWIIHTEMHQTAMTPQASLNPKRQCWNHLGSGL